LICLRNSLRDIILKRLAETSRLQTEAKQIKRQLEQMEHKLGRGGDPNLAEESEQVSGVLKKKTLELKQLEQKVLKPESVTRERRKVASVRSMVREQLVDTTESQQLVSELRISVRAPRSGSPSKRAPGRFNMGGGFAVGEAKVLTDVPVMDVTRARAFIYVPASGRQARPGTLHGVRRTSAKFALSARASPQEQL
jgi:hypothetical protein